VFAIPGICALIVFILTRPQEAYPLLQKVPFLYLFCAMAIFGFVVDLKLRLLRPSAVPTLPLLVAFVIWIILVDATITPPETLIPRIIEIAVVFLIYGITAHAVQGFRTLQLVAGTTMVACLFLSAVGVHQGLAPLECVMIDEANPGEGLSDGRSCETADDCGSEDSGAAPGAEYECEHAGMFGTTSVELRVRYRGELQDPNELAVTICIGGLSFLLAFATRSRRPRTTVLAIAAALIVFWCIVMTQSRGGQLVFLAVLGVFFGRQLGWKGLAAGALMGLVVMSLGGRSGSAADESTEMRYEAWRAGLDMFRSSPLFGVGHRQFAENHNITAHNSYVLVMAELGIVGMVLWLSSVYLSIKIAWKAMRDLRDEPGAAVARTWALALLASWVGLCIQMMFLSFAYHSVLWLYFGLSGALYSAVRRHRPDWTVTFGLKDLAIVIAICVAFVGVILPVFLRLKHF
jgi:hypothetical protein